MPSTEQIIAHTKNWIIDVVIGCNFCPFASREVKNNSIHYQVEIATDLNACLQSFMKECERLDNNGNIETTLLIFPLAFQNFEDYLNLLEVAQKLLKKEGYEGIYQVASFHPLYIFEGSNENDAANFTNRSVYPMLHLLREEKVEEALQHYQNPEQIPERNIKFARDKGKFYMHMLKQASVQ